MLKGDMVTLGKPVIDVKWIRDHPQALDASLVKRGGEPKAQYILDTDAARRASVSALQHWNQTKNRLAQEIAKAKSTGVSCDDLVEQASALKNQSDPLEREAAVHSRALDTALSELPNILDSDVPAGKTEADNVEIRQWGHPQKESFFKDHVSVGQGLGGMDFEQAALVSGARFVYLQGGLARLERALANWMLTVHTEKYGYEEISVPYLVREEGMFASGQLPKFEADLFRTTEGSFLIPTAEVSLVNWAREKKFPPQSLPRRLTAYTPCFRSEVGAAGRDVHGMMRMHQFHKVEMVSICTAEEAEAEHQRMVAQAEYLLQQLELPYRVVLLCAGDTGFCAAKTYDLEVWVPSENRYREISSCSNCGTFQSIRANVKVDLGNNTWEYAHMLNGSGLPTGRTLLAILENYQQKDGSVLIPSVLQSYMGNLDRLSPITPHLG